MKNYLSKLKETLVYNKYVVILFLNIKEHSV